MRKKHDNKDTRFYKKIRIAPDQLEWIRNNKDTKTMAGYLDRIINEYKNEML